MGKRNHGCSDEVPELSPFINYCTGETKSSHEIQQEMLRAVREEDFLWAVECRKELERRGEETDPDKFQSH